jgi:uncharacterized protein
LNLQLSVFFSVMRHVRVLLASAVLLGLGVSALAQQTPPQEPPLITVSGTGSIAVDPDQAIVTLGVENRSATAQEAMNATNAVAQKIVDALLKLGIERSQIRTGSLNLYRTDRSVGPGQPARPPEWVAANILTVTLHDVRRAGPAIDAAMAAGANTVQGVAFGLRDDRAAKQAALRQAVEDARAKAQAIAQALGVELWVVHEVVEQNAGVMPPMMRGMMGDTMVETAQAAVVEPGQVTSRANVTIRWRFRYPN